MAAVMKPVVAIWVVFVPGAAVGAAGVPVRAGLALGARLDTATPLSLASLPVVPLNVAMLSAMAEAGPAIRSVALIPLSLPTFPVVPAKVTMLSATEDAGPEKSP